MGGIVLQFKQKRVVRRYWPVAALSLLLAGALVWGGVGWSRERSLERSLVNEYTKTFYEVVGGMDTLEISLSKIIVSASPGSNLTLLSDISRQANSMLSNLSSLPVSHQAFSDTIKFVNQLGDFCGSLERPAGDGMPLSTQNMDTLIELHNICAGLSGELGALQREGVAFAPLDPASWLDGTSVDEAFTGLGQDESGVTYPTLIYDGPFSEGLQQQTAQGLTGDAVDEEGARLAAADFLGLDPDSVRVTSAIQSKIQGVMLEADAAGGLTYLTVTLQGGHIQWMMEESGAAQEIVSVDRCVDNARVELEKLGYADLAVTWTQRYDGILIINFAYCADGVIFYPDLVKARVRMDDGSLCGLDATGWLMNHHDRPGQEPAITAEEAQKLVSPQLAVESMRLAVIPTGGGGENLCWEFKGDFGGDTFFVYIDSVTGREANIFRVINTDTGALVV